MLRRVALVRTTASEEIDASIIRVKRIGHLLHSVNWLLVTANFVPSSPVLLTLLMEAKRSSETSILMKVTQHNIPEDGIFYYSLHFSDSQS
jgi:hypothetical protein